MSVFDVRGREVVRLVNGAMDAGRHTVEWSGRTSRGDRVASGVYYYTLRSGAFHQTHRMVLLK